MEEQYFKRILLFNDKQLDRTLVRKLRNVFSNNNVTNGNNYLHSQTTVIITSCSDVNHISDRNMLIQEQNENSERAEDKLQDGNMTF